MPYPRKVSAEQRALLRQVALTRRHVADVLKTLPTNDRLAREIGVSRGAIEQILAQELAAHDEERQNEVDAASDAADGSIRDSRIENEPGSLGAT